MAKKASKICEFVKKYREQLYNRLSYLLQKQKQTKKKNKPKKAFKNNFRFKQQLSF